MNDDRAYIPQRTSRPLWWRYDDPQPVKCAECGLYGKGADKMVLTLKPTATTQVFHRSCLDPKWLRKATFMGDFTPEVE